MFGDRWRCLQVQGMYKHILMIDDAIAISECGPDSIKVNALIQSKVKMKNLRLGHSKCFRMHVGKNKNMLPCLTCKRWDYKYEYNKGIGIANKIIGLLKEISFGQYYFQMAILFRQSMLIKGIMCNSEVLYGVSKTHIETLEANLIFS